MDIRKCACTSGGCYDNFMTWHPFTKTRAANRRFWYCAYRLPNGKRTFRSTKLTDRKAADEFCRRLEYASHESKAGRLTEARAHELISEIVQQTTGEPLRNYTAEEWFREWLQGKKATKSESTFLKYANAVNGFLASVAQRATLNVNQIAPRDVHRFRQSEIEAGKHASTTNDNVRSSVWCLRRRASKASSRIIRLRP
jgi:hypothetical protein